MCVNERLSGQNYVFRRALDTSSAVSNISVLCTLQNVL